MYRFIFIVLFLLTFLQAKEPNYGAILIRDRDGDSLSIDNSTWAMVGTDYDHHENHEGNVYQVIASNSDLDIGDTLSISWYVPGTAREQHLKYSFNNTVGAKMKFCEGPTVDTATGTNAAITNHNRRSTNTSMIQHPNMMDTSIAVVNMGMSAAGVVLDSVFFGTTGNPSQTESGEGGGLREIITDSSTVYNIMIVGTADDGVANINLSWYEHTPKP